MSGGGSSDRVPPGLPELEQPPGYIEGPGGGPAFPVGAGGGQYTADEKALFGDLSTAAAGVAAGATIVAGGFAMMGPAFAIAAGAWTAAAGVWALDAVLLGEMAQDPPQPNYRRVVAFPPRTSAPPGGGDPVLGPLAVAAQRSALLLVTARGSLDAVERLQGAAAAGDRDWALTHKGVAVQARWALAVDLATLAAALQAAGRAVAGTPHDVALAPGARAGTAWLETPPVRAGAPGWLRQAGLTPAEVDRALAYLRSDPPYQGSATTTSAHLTATGAQVYDRATQLGAIGG
jgi:hypothetical protein